MAKDGKDNLAKFKCVIMWAHMAEPNTGGKFPSNKYEFTATNLSPAAAQRLAELGIPARTKQDKPEWGHFIKCKSEIPFFVKNEDGTAFTELKAVGNGTEALVTVAPYDYNYRGKTGKSPSAKKVVITELKEYQADVDDSDVEEM